ncbi:MAG: cation-translocating P-type ATPase C-terminal domain-containing protein, partial [Candidatus Babeliales bacterium]
NLLTKQWLEKQTHLFDAKLMAKTIYMAFPMALGSLALFIHYSSDNIALARTITLVTMAMFQWFNAWNCRSMEKTVIEVGLFKNKWLITATLFVVSATIIIVYTPLFQPIFKTVPLTANQWLIMFGVSSSIFFIEEIRKYIVARYIR